MEEPRLLPLEGYQELSEEKMLQHAATFYECVRRRRTVREFSSRRIPPGVVENCIRSAGTAPSGANLQPWRFVIVSDPIIKRRIREAAEREEREFYSRRAPKEWLDVLAPLGTNEHKPFLVEAPCLIAIFVKRFGICSDGTRVKHYYANESVGLASGILITALHYSGLATLTHTPSPMGFLNEILGRPDNEQPFLLLVVGYPREDARVPDIVRKPLEEILVVR